jgi:peptidoglycan/xylan/chitin deacetylase (PgdA/CDA1 family)
LISFEVLQSLSSYKIILPLYHTVSDRKLPHIENLYKVKTIAEFRRDLDFFQKKYQSVSSNGLIDIIENSKKPHHPVFHLSFDDGLKEARTVIAPILLEKGIHATFFLAPDFLDNKKLFYRFKVSLIINALKLSDSSGFLINKIKHMLSPIDGDSVQRQLLNLTYNDTDILDEIGGLLNISFERYLEKESPFLSIDDVHWLINKGFTIGAHSLDHPKYSDIPLKEQLYQTKESLNYLKLNFDIKEKLFAFPFTDVGVSDDFFKKLLDENIISFGTSGLSKQKHKFNLQRIPMEREQISPVDILKLQYLKCLLNA